MRSKVMPVCVRLPLIRRSPISITINCSTESDSMRSCVCLLLNDFTYSLNGGPGKALAWTACILPSVMLCITRMGTARPHPTIG